MPEPCGLHAAAKQVESQIEIERILCVKAKERHRRGFQPLRGCSCLRHRLIDDRAEGREGTFQHLGINVFLGFEMEVERGRRIARANRDGPTARALQPFLGEALPSSLQDQFALVPADGFAPGLWGFGYTLSRSFLDSISGSDQNSNNVQ